MRHRRHRNRIIGRAVTLVAVLAAGTDGFMWYARVDLLSAACFAITAVTTVGFGDIHPDTVAGRVLTRLVPAGLILVFGLGFTGSRLDG